MPVAIETDLYGSLNPPAVVVTVSDLVDAAVDILNVYREAPNTERKLVRGGYLYEPVSDALVIVDLEAEVGRPLIYVVEYWSGGQDLPFEESADAITVPDPGRHILSDSFTGVPVLVDLIATNDEREQTVPASVLRPIGRRRPIALYDVRGDDTGELVVYTRDLSEGRALLELLESGAPIVSRHPFDGCDVPGSEVLFFPTAVRARRSKAGDRTWTMPFVVVDTPDPRLAVSLVTLADLDTFYDGETLADIALDFPTLVDIAQSDLGTA